MDIDAIPEPEFDRASSVDDIATQVEERERAAALAAHRDRVAATLKLPTGVCANCTEVLPKDIAHGSFCDTDCQHDYERRVSARRRNGGH